MRIEKVLVQLVKRYERIRNSVVLMSYRMENSTGYGPTARLQFNGDERNYEVWEIKFMASWPTIFYTA